ncbi:glutathione S-transferase [soil metagenome]
MSYKLWYWSGIQGRGEFVRLALEAGGIAYQDLAREKGDAAMMADIERHAASRGAFAPPYLETEDGLVSQVANVLAYLGEKEGLAPRGLADRHWLNGIQLTIADLVAEAHNVHHPVAIMDYYEDQKPEAKRAAAQFREGRMPKFLGYFEAALGANQGDWLMGANWSYGDTSLFQIVEGLRYMFPKRMAAIEGDYPALIALRDRVAELEGIKAYLASDRRLAFNTQGIFRHYPELDAK